MTDDDAIGTVAAGGLTVSRVGVETVDTLAAMHRSCFTQGWSAGVFRQLLAIPGTVALIATGGAGPQLEVKGFVVARTTFETSEVVTLGVLPDCRRHGVGHALVDRVCRLVGGTGATSVFLEVDETNAAALALYRAHGFSASGRRRDYYRGRNGTRDAIVMTRRLGEPSPSGVADT